MNHQITISSGEIIVDKFDMIMGLLAGGFTIALAVIVVVAAIRIGWNFAGLIFALGFIAWLLF